MIKIAFCDDDRSVLAELGSLMDEYQVDRELELESMAFYSPLELIAKIEKGTQFDILFLDVLMPGVNGIETAQEIREYDHAMKIIFLTSSVEYAVESYTVNAYFYQLKPIQKESLYSLMDSVIGELKKEQKQNLILRCKNGITRIDLDQLMYCEVQGRTLIFHMQDGEVLESLGSMDELNGHLAKYPNFLRPHRSYLVNMEYIRNISSKAIQMTDESKIPVPHGKCSEIKQQYLEYAFSKDQVIFT